MANLVDIHVGDQVQITGSAIDVTNGVKAGSRYTEGGSEWGYVQGIYPNWTAGYGANRGKAVTKVRILGLDRSTVVWQVEPQHISSNIIHASGCGPKPKEPAPPVSPPKPPAPAIEKPPSITSALPNNSRSTQRGPIPIDAFVTTPRSDTWLPPGNDTKYSKLTQGAQTGILVTSTDADGNPISQTHILNDAPFNALLKNSPVRYRPHPVSGPESASVRLNQVTGLEEAYSYAIDDPDMKRLILNDEPAFVVNGDNYPMPEIAAEYSKLVPTRYDYRVLPNDDRYPRVARLEDQLMQARAAFGLPVHGNNDIAKTMKYFLYNRFKVPDTNLAHNKSFTHVFFSRPDLNILEGSNGNMTIATQCKHHSEASMTWMQNPSLFKLLVDGTRCGDSNNFNMLLSNAVTSISIEDENLTYQEAGRSWGEHAIQYGDSYSGQTAGEISVNFVDDKEYSVITLLKLWITYIHNVARGAWIPSYNLNGLSNVVSTMINGSHVYTRTLDYAAGLDVIKVSEDGSEIIYWTKYYGIFPINTGAGALSWDSSMSPGDSPKLNIRFRYSYKRDKSPVSLLEFNRNAMVTDQTSGRVVKYERQWSDEYNHSNRPYVGTPFIQFSLPSKAMLLGHDKVIQQQTGKLRLQFLEAKRVIGEMDEAIFKP